MATSFSRQAWQASSMDETPGLWLSLWYTAYTTVRTAILTPICYVLMVAFVRATGTRAMAGITIFDRLAVVAMGSMLASAALRPTTPLVAYVVAVGIILGLQMAIDWLLYWKILPVGLLSASPQLVVANGHFVDDQLHRLCLSRHKMYSMLRQKGLRNLRGVKAAVLEGSGTLSVIMADDQDEDWDAHNDFSHDDLLDDVQGYTKNMRLQHNKSMEKSNSTKLKQATSDDDNSV